MRNYLRILLFSALALIASTIAINVSVDPYSISGIVLPRNANVIKPQFGDKHALGKPFIASRQKQPVVIFGTSRENHGIDPSSKAWPTTIGGGYNLAMDAANIVDIDRLVEHVIQSGNAQELIIALDFLNMFDTNVHGAESLDPSLLLAEDTPRVLSLLNASRYFASWEMLTDSYHTLRNQNRDAVEFESTGRRNERVFSGAARRFGQHYMFAFSESRYFRARLNLPLAERHSLTNHNTSMLTNLAAILDRAADKGIHVTLFITPVHARQLEVYRTLGLWETLEDWKRAVASIASGKYLRRTSVKVPLWDFGDYSEFTTESVPAPQDKTTRMRWYWESSHYTKALGDLVIDRMFNGKHGGLHPSFGVLLDSVDIESHLAAIRKRGINYRDAHPNDVEDLRKEAADVVATGITQPM